MFNLRTLLLSIVSGVLLISGSSYALAQSPSISTPSLKTQKYCQRVTTTIAKIIADAPKRLANRQKYVTDRKSNIQKRIANLNSKGAAVSTLQNDAQQFFNLLDVWITDYQKYITLIQNAQNFTCGSSNGQFVKAVQQARNQLKVVNSDSKSFKTYYQNTLTNDFKNARLSIKNAKNKNIEPTKPN